MIKDLNSFLLIKLNYLYLLGRVTVRNTDEFIANWGNVDDIKRLKSYGRLKSYLFMNVLDRKTITTLSEWESEGHYTDYINSTSYNEIIQKYKIDYKPDILKLKLVNHWVKTVTELQYYSLIRFSSNFNIEEIQAELDLLKLESRNSKYRIIEIFFYTGIGNPNVFTLLLGWESREFFEALREDLVREILRLSFIDSEFSDIYHLKLIYI